jgi:ATP-dependent DNA helicase RecG
MNSDDIRQLIAQGEGNTIEFKESLPVPAELAKAMVAFANTDGGWLLVGVTDRGDVRGVTFGDREAQLVLNVARNNCVPHLQPTTETVELDDKTVAVIRVERGRQKPYQANERIYVRIGASTRVATQVELLSMLQESGLLSFDQLPVLNATLDDLDLDKARDYLARQTDPAQLAANGDVLELLTHLKAVVRYEERRIPSIGGLLLFGKYPQRELMHSELRGFQGRDVVGPITDKQDCRGTLPEIIDQATEFMRRNRRIVPRMEGIRRIDVEEYPLPAVREAIANGVAHRDYALTGSSIRLFLFDDRLEIIRRARDAQQTHRAGTPRPGVHRRPGHGHPSYSGSDGQQRLTPADLCRRASPVYHHPLRRGRRGGRRRSSHRRSRPLGVERTPGQGIGIPQGLWADHAKRILYSDRGAKKRGVPRVAGDGSKEAGCPTG